MRYTDEARLTGEDEENALKTVSEAFKLALKED